MRAAMRRRSTSSFVSPGPRVPMPPPKRERSAPTPIRLDCRYRSCASSTWSFPSRLRAWRAKTSSMSIVRSTIGSGTMLSRFLRWRGRKSLRVITTWASSSAARSAISCALPLPTSVAGSTVARRWMICSTNLRSGGIGQGLQFAQLGIDCVADLICLHRDDESALHHAGLVASGVKRSMSQRKPSLYCGPGRSMRSGFTK